MRKILNPFRGRDGYHCFACSPDNEVGLQMEFFEDGDYVVSQWLPCAHFVGYKNVLHGGIQSTLMDEIAAWACYVKLDTSGMTRSMNVRFKRPAYIDKGPFTIKAKVEKFEHPIAAIKVEFIDNTNVICSTAEVEYYIFSKEKAIKELLFPGREAFFEEVK
jgi:acyl-coenzyme A thioesterase PaaI-like protein